MDRTENLKDLVVLEGEMTRRQTDLERLEAQQRNLSDRVALSTVTIDIVPTASVDQENADTIGDAFSTGWDVFVAVLYRIGFLLAVLAPFLIVGVLLTLLVRFILRRRKATTGALPSTPPVVERTEEPG